jgi:hypothetical protein
VLSQRRDVFLPGKTTVHNTDFGLPVVRFVKRVNSGSIRPESVP